MTHTSLVCGVKLINPDAPIACTPVPFDATLVLTRRNSLERRIEKLLAKWESRGSNGTRNHDEVSLGPLLFHPRPIIAITVARINRTYDQDHTLGVKKISLRKAVSKYDSSVISVVFLISGLTTRAMELKRINLIAIVKWR